VKCGFNTVLSTDCPPPPPAPSSSCAHTHTRPEDTHNAVMVRRHKEWMSLCLVQMEPVGLWFHGSNVLHSHKGRRVPSFCASLRLFECWSLEMAQIQYWAKVFVLFCYLVRMKTINHQNTFLHRGSFPSYTSTKHVTFYCINIPNTVSSYLCFVNG
jgi:hypothetical protein